MTYDIINHTRGDAIWFHTTLPNRLESILENGLKISSDPNWQIAPEPWIYLSTVPWHLIERDHVIFEIDLSGFSENEAKSECGWAFADPDDEKEWKDRWQLRVFRDIPPERIRKVTPWCLSPTATGLKP